MPLKMQETYVNRTKGYRYGESPVYETAVNTMGELFRRCQKEFGRCDGKIFADTTAGTTEHVGWVFSRMSRYEGSHLKDKNEWYCREVWVTVFPEIK